MEAINQSGQPRKSGKRGPMWPAPLTSGGLALEEVTCRGWKHGIRGKVVIETFVFNPKRFNFVGNLMWHTKQMRMRMRINAIWNLKMDKFLTKTCPRAIFWSPFAALWTTCTDPHLKVSHIPIFTLCSRNYKNVACFRNNSCPKSHQKGETKRKLYQLKHKSFSSSPTHACEVWKRGTPHKVTFNLLKVQWTNS